MPQEIVRDRIARGVPGLPYGDDNNFISRTNQNPQAKKIVQVTVDTASDDTDYTVSINGVEVTYHSGSGATTETIRDGLITAIKDEPLVSGHVTPEAGGSTDVLTLTGMWPGEAFPFSEEDSNLSSTTTQSAADADPIPFGRAVVFDGLSLEEDGQGATLADASFLTAGEVIVDLTDGSGDTYIVTVEVEGQTYRAQFNSSGGGADTLANNLRDGLNADLPSDTVDASVNGSDQLVLTAETAGRPFDVSLDREGSNGGSISIASDNRGRKTDVNAALAGVSAVKHNTEYQAGDGAQIQPNDVFDVLQDGCAVVEPEASLSADDDVWVRLSANGSSDKLGVFRGSKDTGCVRLSDASWRGTAGNLAVLEIS